MGMNRWLAELRRRNVLRALILYAGAVWALAQGIAQLAPVVGAPEASARWFLVAAAIGLPFWLLLAWLYEFTPAGLRREDAAGSDTSRKQATRRRLDAAIIAVLSVAVILLLSNQFLHRHPSATKADAPSPHSIAVLPFANLSTHQDNAWFVDGMQDLILTKLAGIQGLKVISRTSVQGYEPKPVNLAQVALELGVATLLEGSVQRHGDDVLINVQLIDARHGDHLWAESYRRTLGDVFGVEGEVAGKIATALRVQLSPPEAAGLTRAPTHDKAAFDLYLRAEQQFAAGRRDFDTAPFKQAIALYREALQHDPGFALAQARLAYSESLLAWLGGGGSDLEQLKARAQLDAERAVEMAPDDPGSHVAKGYFEVFVRDDDAAAAKAFDAALALQPGYAPALSGQAELLRRAGDFHAVARNLEQLRVLDPRNSGLAFSLGVTCMVIGDYPRAENALRRALQIDPDNLNARFYLSNAILFQSGDLAAALHPLQGEAAHMKLQRATLFEYMRKPAEALSELAGVPDIPENFQPGLDAPKSLLLADLNQLAGERALAQKYYRQALLELRAQQTGQDPASLAFIVANIARTEIALGDVADGLNGIQRALALVATTNDPMRTASPRLLAAIACAEAGRADLATPLLDAVLSDASTGYIYAPVMLGIDPAWDPIRNDPLFLALVQRHPAGGSRSTAPSRGP